MGQLSTLGELVKALTGSKSFVDLLCILQRLVQLRPTAEMLLTIYSTKSVGAGGGSEAQAEAGDARGSQVVLWD